MPNASEDAGPPFSDIDPHIYFNGFSLAVGAGDVIITLARQGKPVGTLNTSFTLAKTLGQALTTAIKTLEKKTDHTIMTVEEVGKGLNKQS